MLSNKYTRLHEELLSEIESVGLNTKQAQKDFISNANRIIECVKSDADRAIREELMGMSDSDRDAFLHVRWSLPIAVYVHQYKGALAKFKKAAKTHPLFSKKVEALESVSQFVEDALTVKAMKPAPRKTRTDVERDAHEARWKKLPKASQDTVTSIIEAVTPEIEKRHEARTTMLFDAKANIKKELDEQPDNKSYREAKKRLTGRFGAVMLGLLLSSDQELKKALESERTGEYRKISYAATQRLGEYAIDKAVADNVQSGADGVECQFTLFNNGVAVANFGFKGIFAGGYNIQRLHVRTIFNDTKL